MVQHRWYGQLGLTTGRNFVRKRTFSPVCQDPVQTTLLHGPIAPAQADSVGANVAEVFWTVGSRWDGPMASRPPSSLLWVNDRKHSVMMKTWFRPGYSWHLVQGLLGQVSMPVGAPWL